MFEVFEIQRFKRVILFVFVVRALVFSSNLLQRILDLYFLLYMYMFCIRQRILGSLSLNVWMWVYFFVGVLVILEPKYMLKCHDYPAVMVIFFLIFLLAKDICFTCAIFAVFFYWGWKCYHKSLDTLVILLQS